jgi:two-component system response regulator YesN
MYKVLLVDDEYLEREALKIILHEEVEEIMVVGEASTGRKAVELSETQNPDMIFMDIRMPGMDGLEATEIIKSRYREKIIIILTAYDDFRYAQKAIKAGADDYILKPARPSDIIEAVKKHMILKESRKEARELNVDELIHQIHKEDYKCAREKLKTLVHQLIRIYGEQQDQLKEHAQIIAKKMMEACEQKGLKPLQHWNAGRSPLEGITLFTVKERLFKILDHVFEEIVHGKAVEDHKEIYAVLNYIEKNIHRPIALEEAAEYVHLSSYYLSKLFKKELNINFIQYVTERRMERAKELLENTDAPILNIALDLSYHEPNYFSKVFKKVVGMTPTEYRESKEKEKSQ